MEDQRQVETLPLLNVNLRLLFLFLGFMSQIARFPSDGLGIAVFSNDDEYGGTLHTILKWYLADVALGLKPIDWDGRLVR